MATSITQRHRNRRLLDGFVNAVASVAYAVATEPMPLDAAWRWPLIADVSRGGKPFETAISAAAIEYILRWRPARARMTPLLGGMW